MDVTSRQEQLRQISALINEDKKHVQEILKSLGWDAETTVKAGNIAKKQKIDQGPGFPPSKNSIKLDSETVSDLIGCHNLNMQDASSTTLSADQKLGVYNYCIQKTGRLSEPEISVLIQPEEGGGSHKTMTFAEIVARKRNAKRRTIRYRTGVSHSYVGELRSLIELQMSALSQYIDNKSDKLLKDTKIDKNIGSRKYRSQKVARSPEQSSSSSYRHKRTQDRTSYRHKEKDRRRSPKRHQSRDTR